MIRSAEVVAGLFAAAVVVRSGWDLGGVCSRWAGRQWYRYGRYMCSLCPKRSHHRGYVAIWTLVRARRHVAEVHGAELEAKQVVAAEAQRARFEQMFGRGPEGGAS